MFPLTHLYIARLLLEKENTMTSLGALFPDFGAYIGLGRTLCHENSLDMFYFACEEAADHRDFALGALTHSIALPGIDYYADEFYHGKKPGFCFQKAKKYSDAVAKVCGLPENMAIWKTHNVVEMAFDVLTEEKNPGIGKFALSSFPDSGSDSVFCTSFCQKYLNKDRSTILKMFLIGKDTFSFDGNNIDEMAGKFISSLAGCSELEACDKEELKHIICDVAEDIRPLYDSFMEECLKEIRQPLAPLLVC